MVDARERPLERQEEDSDTGMIEEARADARYVTVAVGRDYRDVPPTSGSYHGPAVGSLRTSRLLESEPLAA